MKLLLDTNVIAKICHPSEKYREAQAWFHTIVSSQPPVHEIVVSAITLYELRLGLIRSRATESLAFFQGMTQHLRWIPLTREATQLAADLWVKIGTDKSVPQVGKKVSDADLFIVAQALLEKAGLVTSDNELIALGPELGLDVRDWTGFDPTNPNG